MKTKKRFGCNTYRITSQFLVLIIFCFSLSACVRSHTNAVFSANGGKLSSGAAVDINSASENELEKLPFIGEGYARKIVEHREKHGRFRRAEHLLLIEGITDKKFRQIQNRIKVE